MSDAPAKISVEIWSDVVCPWCYIGKRRFERALAQLDGEIDVDVAYRPYQLDPRAAPGVSEPVFDAYVRKFGGPAQAQMLIDRVTAAAAEDGIEFRLDRARRANTLLAHRLLWLAEQPDSPVAQADLKERLLRAYFVEGVDIGDTSALAELAADAGFDRAVIDSFLTGTRGSAEVADHLEAAAEAGITAVPTFVVDGRWAIPGAQDPATFVAVLRRLVDQLRPAPDGDTGGDARPDDARAT